MIIFACVLQKDKKNKSSHFHNPDCNLRNRWNIFFIEQQTEYFFIWMLRRIIGSTFRTAVSAVKQLSGTTFYLWFCEICALVYFGNVTLFHCFNSRLPWLLCWINCAWLFDFWLENKQQQMLELCMCGVWSGTQSVVFDTCCCCCWVIVMLGAHLDVMHAHEIPTVVQVLFKVTVLEDTTAKVFTLKCVHKWGQHLLNSCTLNCRCTHEILKHQSEAALGVDDVVQCDDVGVFQVLQ